MFQYNDLSSNVSDYKLLECIGKGNFGQVYKAIYLPYYNDDLVEALSKTATTTTTTTGTASDNISNSTSNSSSTSYRDEMFVAIKIIDLEDSDEDIAAYSQEIFFLASFKNTPSIVKYYKTFITKNYKMWIVMEYCGSGSCMDLVKALPVGKFLSEVQISFVIRQMLISLNILHKENKIHRDIKLANVLITSTGKVKLSDFGVSGNLNNNTEKKLQTFVGTPYYMAPEIITNGYSPKYLKMGNIDSIDRNSLSIDNGKFLREKKEERKEEEKEEEEEEEEEEEDLVEKTKGYDEMADVWSLGITVFELFEKRAPYSNKDPMKMINLIPKREPPKLSDCKNNTNKPSLVLQNFVSCCLKLNPKERSSIDKLLKHKFITKHLNCNESSVLSEPLEYLRKYKLLKKASKKRKQQQQLAGKSTPRGSETQIESNTLQMIKNNQNDKTVTIRKNINSFSMRRDTTQLNNVLSMWNFDTTNMSPTSLKTGSTQQTNSPMSYTDCYHSNNTTKGGEKKNKTGHAASTAPTTAELSVHEKPRATTAQNPPVIHPFNDIMAPLFDNMTTRALNLETKQFVQNLKTQFYLTELKLNGFTDAFLEELVLKLQELKMSS